MKKKRNNLFRIIILSLLIIFAIFCDWPGGVNISVPKPKVTFDKKTPYVHFATSGNLFQIKKDYQVKEGLDIQGGSHLVYSADLSKIAAKNQADAMDSLKKVIENRVNAFGVSEPQVYTTKVAGENRLVVELAGVKDTEQAKTLIGKTAQLEFKEIKDNNFVSTGLTGNDFQHADVAFDPNTNAPIIEIQFNSAGAQKFSDITGRNVGKPLAIYLDSQLISAPTVDNQISGGKGQISGKFTVQEAKDLSIELNAGSLPVPIKIIEQRTVGATLGQESIAKSFVAAIIGILFV